MAMHPKLCEGCNIFLNLLVLLLFSPFSLHFGEASTLETTPLVLQSRWECSGTKPELQVTVNFSPALTWSGLMDVTFFVNPGFLQVPVTHSAAGDNFPSSPHKSSACFGTKLVLHVMVYFFPAAISAESGVILAMLEALGLLHFSDR
jgi:hypothetical protein